MKRTLAVTALVLLIALAGCSLKSGPPAATEAIDAFYTLVQEGNYESAARLAGEQASITQEEFRTYLEEVNSEYGAVESYTVDSWNMKTIGEADTKGAEYTLTYEVERTIQSSRETFTLYKEEWNDPVKISSYTVEALEE